MKDETKKPGDSADPLDAMLREANTYTDDNGFTNRVLASLPAKQSRFPVRAIAIAIASIVSLLIVAWWIQTDSQLLAICKDRKEWKLTDLAFVLPSMAVISSLLFGVFSLVEDES